MICKEQKSFTPLSEKPFEISKELTGGRVVGLEISLQMDSYQVLLSLTNYEIRAIKELTSPAEGVGKSTQIGSKTMKLQNTGATKTALPDFATLPNLNAFKILDKREPSD